MLTEETQRSLWIREQQELAAKVLILPDEQAEAGRNDRFATLPLPARKGNEDNDTVYYGGVDVSFPENENDPAVAVYVVLDAVTLQVVYQDHEYFKLTVPYVPSFLAFREIDPLERLVKKQMKEQASLTPKAILVDGNGVLHSRGAGIACFLGVRTGIPTIGIGKTLFYEGGLTRELVDKGIDESVACAAKRESPDWPFIYLDQTPIAGVQDNRKIAGYSSKIDRSAILQRMSPKLCHGLALPLDSVDGRRLACALVGHGGRTTAKKTKSAGTKNPIFVSVGHRISLQSAVKLTAALSKSRIPEPVRQADLLGRDMFRQRPKNASTTPSFHNGSI